MLLVSVCNKYSYQSQELTKSSESVNQDYVTMGTCKHKCPAMQPHVAWINGVTVEQGVDYYRLHAENAHYKQRVN